MAVVDEPASIPALPALQAPMPPFPGSLRRSVEGDRFTILGRRARLSADGGELTLRTFSPRVASRLRVGGARCISAMARPAGLERTLALGNTRIRERLLLARDLPALLIEWESDNQVLLPVRWGLELPDPVLPDGMPVFRELDRGLLVRDGAAVAIAVSESFTGPPDVRRGQGAASAAFSLRLPAGRAVRLAIAIGVDEEELKRLLRHIDRPEPLVNAYVGAGARLAAELAVASPDPRFADAVEWAKLRLSQAFVEWPDGDRAPVSELPRLGRADPFLAIDDALRIGMGLLCIGEHDAVREILRMLGRLREAEGRTPAVRTMSGERKPGGPDAEAAHLLLLSRYHAWSGDHAFVRAAWPRVAGAWQGCITGPEDDAVHANGTDRSLCRTALDALAQTADSIGESKLAETLRGALGSPPDPASLWSVDSAGSTECAVTPAVSGPDWGGPTGDDTGDAVSAGSFLVSVVEGLLGARPDATVGRLTLRPRLPDWDWFRMEHLRVGPNHIGFEYRREGGRHELRIRQERGAVPLQLVLEPALAATRLIAASVDGAPAELDSRPEGGRLLVPIQLMVDDERTVLLETDQPPRRSTRNRRP